MLPIRLKFGILLITCTRGFCDRSCFNSFICSLTSGSRPCAWTVVALVGGHWPRARSVHVSTYFLHCSGWQPDTSAFSSYGYVQVSSVVA